MRKTTLSIFSIVMLLLVSLASAQDETPDTPLNAAQATGKVPAQVMNGMQATGTTRVIVQLEEPISAATPGDRKRAIAGAQSSVLAATTAPGLKVGFRYQTVPAFSAEITNPQALAALAQNPRVKAIEPDLEVRGFLGESVTALDADYVHNLGVTGAGVTVAVLDSGVDTDHPDIIDNLIAQKCYNSSSDCEPGNVTVSNSAEDENGHGTHVTGIVTSGGVVAPTGFAPDADIVAVRVLDTSNNGSFSNILSGLDWLNANYATTPIHVINMSLGTSAAYSIACDASSPTLYNAIQQLVDRGVVVFAASGNDANSTYISLPACFSNVVAVGATYDGNNGSVEFDNCTDPTTSLTTIACITNSNTLLSILAPGARITSSWLYGGQTTIGGTSMATPTAAGVAALMLEVNPTLSPTSVELLLQNSGILVTDTRNGLQIPLINALGAVNLARYDRNTDGAVNELDVQYVLDRAGTTDPTADVNQDGIITPTDALEIVNWIAP